jgi:hypothetical protein
VCVVFELIDLTNLIQNNSEQTTAADAILKREDGRKEMMEGG